MGGSWLSGTSKWDSGRSTRGLSDNMAETWWSAVMLLVGSVISLNSSFSVRRGKITLHGAWEGDHTELCSQTEVWLRAGSWVAMLKAIGW